MKNDGLFKSLGDPTRLRIVMLLLDEELCVCDIESILHLPQSTVSRHMARLSSAGVVVARREIVWIHYRLAQTAVIDDLRTFLRTQFAKVNPYRQDRATLETYVSEGKCAIPQRQGTTKQLLVSISKET